MQAGRLRHAITIQKIVETDDGMGGFTEVWSEYTTARASITPLKGIELLEHKKLGHEAVDRLWIRYQSGITTKMRVLWGERIMEIIGFRNPEEKNKMLEITVKEMT